MKYLTKLALVLLLTAGLTACSDFLKPSTPQKKPIESVDDVQDLEGLMSGAYNRLSQVPLYGRDYVLFGDVRTGNAWSNGSSGRFTNESMLRFTPQGSVGIWDSAYEVIANANIIIHSDVKGKKAKRIKGQAYALRALAHMILLKTYGQQYVEGSNLGIPYVTTFAKAKNFFPKRLTVEQTYAKIEADYKKALSLLNPTIYTSTKMSYYGVKALLSRFYLFTENYKAAAAAAKDVIDSGVYALVPANEYVAAWAKDGQPAVIFEVAFNASDSHGSDSIYQMLAGDSYGDVEVTKELYNLYGSNDVRKKLYGIETSDYDKDNPWKAYRMVGKFQSKTRNTPVIRYAEVILNYAEAKFRLGQTSTARTYLNKIAKHRNAETYGAPIAIDDILLERRKELAMEGHYFWTLMRTKQDIERANMRTAIDANQVSVPYGNYRLALPIPIAELDANPKMKQNKGY